MLYIAARYYPLQFIAVLLLTAVMGFFYWQMLNAMARTIVVTPIRCECPCPSQVNLQEKT